MLKAPLIAAALATLKMHLQMAQQIAAKQGK